MPRQASPALKWCSNSTIDSTWRLETHWLKGEPRENDGPQPAFGAMLHSGSPAACLYVLCPKCSGRWCSAPNGVVTVNGTLINNSSDLQDNDTVSTGPESVVHITSLASPGVSFVHSSLVT